MVAYVYKTTRGPLPKLEEVLKLSGGRECEVSEFRRNIFGNNYTSEITVGTDEEHIILRGCVVHDLVSSVMRGETLRTQKLMLDYLTRLINGEKD